MTLLPCPFCGKKAKLYKQKFNSGILYEVACQNSKCTYLITQKKNKKKAIKIWNKRKGCK